MIDTEERTYKSEPLTEETLSIDAVVRFLRQWKGTYQELSRQIKTLERDIREKDEELYTLRDLTNVYRLKSIMHKRITAQLMMIIKRLFKLWTVHADSPC